MESDSKQPFEKPADPSVPEGKDILKELKHSGCPVCNHMEEVIFEFLAKWQYALTNDEKVQQEYAAELGFCPAHTWQLSAISSSLGISRGYPQLLEHVAEELAKLNGASADISNGIAALCPGLSSPTGKVCGRHTQTDVTLRGLWARRRRDVDRFPHQVRNNGYLCHVCAIR